MNDQGREVKRKHIEMPPLEEIDAVTRAIIGDSTPNLQQAPAFNTVPDELPLETREMMQQESPEQVEEAEETEQEVEQVVQPKTKSDNFAELRKAREAAERRAERLEREFEMYKEQMYANKKPELKQEVKEDYELNIDDEDLTTGKDIRKVDSRTRALEKKIAQMESQNREMQAEARIRSKYPDLDNVVTDENIYLLRQQEPEIAASLNLAPDSWDKLAAVYTMIKKTGIHKTRAYDSDKIKAVTNVNKPKPLASIAPQTAETPLSKANAFAQDYKLSKESAANTWREMQEAMKKG